MRFLRVPTRAVALLNTVVVLLGLVVASVASASAAQAQTGGYPHSNMPSCATDQCTADPWRFFYRECTSFVAWKLNQSGVAFKNDYDGDGSLDFGNATNWKAAAQRFGLAVDNRPAVGAVAWWSFGHVAWVKSVNGNGTVTIEEYNKNYDGNYTSRDVAVGSVSAYIHFGVASNSVDSGPSASDPFADGAFVYERGSTSQYMMQFGLAFPISGIAELEALGGRDKAVMVQPGSIAPRRGIPSIPHNLLLRAPTESRVSYSVDGSLQWANNDTVLECLRLVHGAQFRLVPASLIAAVRSAGRVTNTVAMCGFPTSWAIHGPGGMERWRINGTNPYSRQQYGSPLALRCTLGSVPHEVAISVAAVNQPVEGPMLGCVDNSYVRNRQNGETFRVMNGTLQYIATPSTLLCLTHGNLAAVVDVEAAVLDGVVRGPFAQCSLEGRMLRAPDGRVVWLRFGEWRWVGSDVMLNCVRVRGHAGDPIPVPWEVFNLHPEGRGAYCPYPASMRFVRGSGQPQVWRVYQDGTRQIASAYCADVDKSRATDPRYKVYVVPAGEVDAHALRKQHVFYATVESCRALP